VKHALIYWRIVFSCPRHQSRFPRYKREEDLDAPDVRKVGEGDEAWYSEAAGDPRRQMVIAAGRERHRESESGYEPPLFLLFTNIFTCT